MSEFRNVSADERMIVVGVPTVRFVAPDEVVTLPDEVDENYDGQPGIWRRVDHSKAQASAKSKAASSD